MKIRNGFVSNSSSSSFIAFLGVIKDEEQFKKYQESIGKTFNTYTYDEVCKEINHCGDFFYYLSNPSIEYNGNRFVFCSNKSDLDYDEDGEPIEEYPDDFEGDYLHNKDSGVKVLISVSYCGRDG